MNERNVELQAITSTINFYIDGLYSGNIEILQKAFHPQAMMYGVNGNAVTIVEIALLRRGSTNSLLKTTA